MQLKANVNFLDEIVAKKRRRLEESKAAVSLDAVIRAATERRATAQPLALSTALRRHGLNVIAEFKRRSPSKGVIRADATPASIAQSYAAGGAIGMSVLTEEDYFDGSLEDLRAVKRAVDLPVLRKDFVFDEYQVYEAAAAGADAILLIVASLDDSSLRRLRVLAEDVLNIDALVEVHTADEMARAAKCGAKLIGVNNRDLQSFSVSLETSLKLAPAAREGSILISESGLNSADDLVRLRNVGYDGFLIGESLMRAERPEQALRNLLGGES